MQPLMPLHPDGTYPTADELAPSGGLMVQPNPGLGPAQGRGLFQRVYLAPSRIPKWLRDGIRDQLGAGGFFSAESVWRVLRREMRRWPTEKFLAIYLDVKNRPVGIVEIAQGILDASLVHPREVFMGAIGAGASSVMVAHNHPSGDPEPSPQDLDITTRLANAGKLLGIPLLDSIVLGHRGYVSLAERGLVDPAARY